MLFEEYLSRLIQYTESRALVMSRQSEAFSSFRQGSSVEFTAEFLMSIGLPPEARSNEYPNF